MGKGPWCFPVLLFLTAGLSLAQSTRPPVTAASATGAKQVEDLLEKADPEADDWTTEVQAHRADVQLKALSKVLVQQREALTDRLSSFFTDDCRMTHLRPEKMTTRTVGRVRVRRVEEDGFSSLSKTDATSAFSSLLAPHHKTAAMRVKFKTVSVEPSSASEFNTIVFFQAFSEGAGTRVQQNATWSIEWVKKPETERPLIKALTPLRFDETECSKPMFDDCTRSVITNQETWFPQLALGSEYWYGRIDAVGEINFMGQNGIAVGDVNGDGLDDLYVGLGTGLPNKLFIQNPDGSVRDTAHDAGVAWLDDTKGVLLVDMNNDGDQDLVCAMGHTIVYCENDGTGRFRPRHGLKAGTPASFYSLAAADYDADGDLDLYACRYVKVRYGISVPIPFYDANNGPTNVLIRNEGNRGLKDATRDAGLHVNNARFSLAATWLDYDNDGDPDLYVANDFGRNNLYRNDGGKFKDVAAETGSEDQAAGMGISWADYDLDGDFDLYVTNMFSSAGRRIAYQSRFMPEATLKDRGGAQRHSLGNTLLANQGDGTFRDESEAAGVRMGRWAWGAMFVDFNNDGYDDLMVPNGFITNEHKDDL
ncbi:MAG: VCBS repeat-containing protein [Phycisphaerales bacterium]|nr:VCBS repeat-containing protein [Phycisphaerales bacterium]